MSIYSRRNFLIRSELYSCDERVFNYRVTFSVSRFTVPNDENHDRMSLWVAKTDLLHFFSSSSCFFFVFLLRIVFRFSLHFSFFLSFSFPLFLCSLITVSRHTRVPLAATSIKLPAPPAVVDTRHRRRRYPRTRAYRRSHVHIHAHTGAARLRFASGRHTDGYGCHAGSVVLYSLSLPFSHRPAIPSPSSRSGTHST